MTAMRNTILRVAAGLALAAVAAPARAHEFTCSETATILHVDRNGDVVVGGDGLPVGTGSITPVLELHAYPAVVGLQVSLANVASATSVVTGVIDRVLEHLAVPPQTFGASIVPGLSLPVGRSAVEWFAVPVASQEQCLQLFGAGGGDAPACSATSDDQFMVRHDAGSTECRARVVCGPPGPPVGAGPPPPPACPPTWHGVKQFPATTFANAHGIALDGSCNASVTGQGGTMVDAFTSGRGAYLDAFDASGQSYQVEQWGNATGSAVGLAVAADAAGNRYVAWQEQRFDQAMESWISKYDAAGTLAWTVPAGVVEVTAVAVDVAGNVYEGGDLQLGAAVSKLGPDGSTIWTYAIAGPPLTAVTAVAVDEAGNVLVGGWTSAGWAGPTNGGSIDAFAAKLDAGGTLVWARLVGGPETEFATGIAPDGSGGAYLGGTTYPIDPTAAHAHAFVARIGADGALLWSAPVGAFISEGVDAIAANASGVWAVGFMDNPAPPGSSIFFTDTDAVVARWDPAGNPLWVKTLGTPGFEEALGIALDAAGDAFVTGEILDGDFGGGTASGAHAFVAKYDPLGNVQ